MLFKRIVCCHSCGKTHKLNSNWIHCLKCNNYFCNRCTSEYNDEPSQKTWDRMKTGKHGESIDEDGGGCDNCNYADTNCDFSNEMNFDCECYGDKRCSVHNLPTRPFIEEFELMFNLQYAINLPFITINQVIKRNKLEPKLKL